MPDKGKVIAGLQCCVIRRRGENRLCSLCPYRDPTIDCTNAMHMDALDLLSMDSGEDAECEECKIDAGQEGEPDD